MAMLMIVAGWAILDETEGCSHTADFGVNALDLPGGRWASCKGRIEHGDDQGKGWENCRIFPSPEQPGTWS